jgi:hypothetical protein
MDEEVRAFVARFLSTTGAETEEADHVTTVKLPRTYWKRMGGLHHYTTDPETFDEKDGEVELLSLGSKFVQGAMETLAEDGAIGTLRTKDVAHPTTALYYRYFIETIRSEIEAFVTLRVDDDGQIAAIEQELAPVPDGEAAAGGGDLSAAAWAALDERARGEVGNLLVPILQGKREEAQAEVRRAEKRLEEYYERQKEEIRAEEAKIRHKRGQIRNRLWFTESGVRERKLEDQDRDLEKQLHDLTFRNNRKVEDLDRELKERLAKEQEKNEPRLTVELIGATRLLPLKGLAAAVVATQKAAAVA